MSGEKMNHLVLLEIDTRPTTEMKKEQNKMGIVGNAFLLTTKEQSQKGIGAEQCNKYNTVLYCETLSLLSLSAKLASKMDSSPQQQAQ